MKYLSHVHLIVNSSGVLLKVRLRTESGLSPRSFATEFFQVALEDVCE